MATPYMFLLTVCVVLIYCAYARKSLATTIVILAVVAMVNIWVLGFNVSLLIIVSIGFVFVLLSHKQFRQNNITQPLLDRLITLLPSISPTEQEAINAGTVWWDGELFSGKPQWNTLLNLPSPELSKEERAFIDGPVVELMRMVDRWDINHNTSKPSEDIIAYIKANGFLGMIIPKKYGGLEFSAMAQYEVLSRMAICGAGVSSVIGVPNSLGPGELLVHYGTEEQKDYYLPRLASGEEVPCFALTGPLAGSDATSVPDTGIVRKGEFNGEDVIGIELNFEKRYISLAPMATLIGLAFQLSDPDHIIGNTNHYGITCALIPRNTPGVEIGRRHKPIGDSFLNGPILGSNVFIPLDYIIGGMSMAGKGWTMLVNCLSVGRCITLPSAGDGIAKQMLLGASSYAAMRQQFGLPIAKFEGVQKPIARIAAYTYMINASCRGTIQALDDGEKPSVPSAILKYHVTEMARQSTLDAMDVLGGKAIMTGPKNCIADAYSSVPVLITVEGANILTRNLMIFGQGATRGHPYLLQEMKLCAQENNSQTVSDFDAVLCNHVGYSLSNAARAFVLGITKGRFSSVTGNSQLAQHYKNINRLSAAFALIADVSLVTLQSSLKRKEMLSAQLGDLLSYLYIASMVLKYHENQQCPSADKPLVEWCMQHLLHRFQETLLEIIQNFPNRTIATIIRVVIFPLGACYRPPSHVLHSQIAALFTSESDTRTRLLEGVFADAIPNNPLGQMQSVFQRYTELAPLREKITRAVRAGDIAKVLGSQQIILAKEAQIITAEEAAQLLSLDEQIMEIIHVDHFDESELLGGT